MIPKIHKIYSHDISLKNILYTRYSCYSANTKILASEIFEIHIFRANSLIQMLTM